MQLRIRVFAELLQSLRDQRLKMIGQNEGIAVVPIFENNQTGGASEEEVEVENICRCSLSDVLSVQLKVSRRVTSRASS